MPAKSEAQRRYLNMKFGHGWVKAHDFDNAGPLPEHVRTPGHPKHYDPIAKALAKGKKR